MKRSLYLVVPLLALTAMALACGGGGDGEERPGASVTPEVTAAVEPTYIFTPIPGTRLAVVPGDLEGFLSQFGEDIPTAVSCDYEEEMAVMNCTGAGFGKFQLVPPVLHTDVECGVRILEDEPVYVSCNSEDPLFGIIYQVVE